MCDAVYVHPALFYRHAVEDLGRASFIRWYRRVSGHGRNVRSSLHVTRTYFGNRCKGRGGGGHSAVRCWYCEVGLDN